MRILIGRSSRSLSADVPRERGRRSGLAPQGHRGRWTRRRGRLAADSEGNCQWAAEAKWTVTVTAQGRGGCQPAYLGESGLGGAEGHVDGRCVARSLVADSEPEGATDMAGAPAQGAAWGRVLGVEKKGRRGLFICVC